VPIIWLTIPNAGKIKIYTSGWPKNQNRCWYNIGSPPPEGSKNEVLKFLSVKSIVIAQAKTGREKRSKNAVIKTDHTNSGNLCIDKPGTLILNMVVIKFIAPNKEEIPAKCKLKIAKSTEPPEWATMELSGG
jgi:hypothetical protein